MSKKCTGMKDINNNTIYEGDLMVRDRVENSSVYRVDYSCGNFHLTRIIWRNHGIGSPTTFLSEKIIALQTWRKLSKEEIDNDKEINRVK